MASKDRSAVQFGSLREQMSLRAQYGLVALLTLLAGYGLLLLSDEVQQMQYQAEANAQALATLSDSAAEDIWIGRSVEAREIARMWSEHSWQAASPGVGAAQIEVALRDLAGQNSAETLQLEVNPEPLRRGNAQFLKFSLSGEFPAPLVHQFLVQMAASEKLLVVSNLQLVAQRNERYSISLDGIAPFEPAEEG